MDRDSGAETPWLESMHFPLGTSLAHRKVMIDVALSILALIAGGLTLELFTAPRPSLRFQEPRGYALGVKSFEAAEDFQSGNPS